MQFYALHDQQLVSSLEAVKHVIYRCPECLRPVRVRGGPHRQTHFYHAQSHPLCTQHKKSLTHLQIQRLLMQKLKGSCMEKAFPTIGRIADVAWEMEKLVFEIQCSGISGEEAESRCKDYYKLGYTVVFILHDKRFNQLRLGAAEHLLRQKICYFTNIDSSGKGIIYDQFDVTCSMKRIFKGQPLTIDLALPQRTIINKNFQNLPDIIRNRLKNSPLFFSGDLIFRTLTTDSPNVLQQIKEIEKKFSSSATPSFDLKSLKNIYKTIFCFFLEKACH